MLVCVECAIQAVLRGENPKEPCRFDQTPEEHMASHHPDPIPPGKRMADLWAICNILNDPQHPRYQAMHQLLQTKKVQGRANRP